MTNTRLHFGQRQQAERMAENGDQLDQCFELVTARAEIERLKAHEHAAATILATALACDNYQPQHMEWMAEAARWLNEPRASHEPSEPLANWQPIDTAPKDGSHILALFHGESYWPVRVLRWGGDQSLWGLPGHCGLEPTHWMPLPANPTTQGASRDAAGHHCLDCGADLSNHPTSASAHRCSPQRTSE